MKTIWKYPLRITDTQVITMPGGSQLLSVQMQNDVPCLWSLVNPDNPPESRIITIHGTGHSVSITAISFIDTIQIRGLVFHVFGDR